MFSGGGVLTATTRRFPMANGNPSTVVTVYSFEEALVVNY